MQAQHLYDTLCQRREAVQLQASREVENRLQDATTLDRQSRDYFDALLQGDPQGAGVQLRALYKSLASTHAGSGYHIVCCYDESGSMRSSGKWQALVQAHQACMKNLQPSCGQVSIIQFDDRARTVLSQATPAQAEAQPLQMRGGGTRFEPALAAAVQQMRAGDRQFTPVLLFMSDGCNDDGPCTYSIQAMGQEFPNLIFHAVIFGQRDSERLRGMVAAAKNGHFHVSVDGIQLEQTFKSIASSLEYTGR